jgi:RNA polymerase sigma-70 factor (ECF subfamily)
MAGRVGNDSESKRALPEGTKIAEVDALVDRARAGDRAAFGQLVERFRPRIYALGLHLTGSRSEADDIAQEAFLRAFHQLAAFEGRSQFFTWLYRIAVNRALNGRRDGARRRTVGLDDPRVQAAIAIDAYGDPRRAAELRQTYSRLVAALDGLSPTLRSTVVLVALQGLSHDEAGVILGCPPGTVAWRMHEARGKLRTAIEGPCKTPEEAEERSNQLMALVPALRGAR